jgi:site-specific DNA-methyltransferase (adenine-specific)
MIDKAAGAKQEVIGTKKITGRHGDAFGYGPEQHQTRFNAGDIPITAPTTDAAKQWDGWGTGLKPAFELIVLARKPLSAKRQ